MPPKPNNSNFNEIKHHKEFYIPGGDVFFHVGDVVIRVHRFFFDRESRIFREQVLPVEEGKAPHGYNDATAITIKVALDDFVKLLRIFYNAKYTLYDYTIADWTRVLELAQAWEFNEVKRLAIRELQKHEMDIISRIALYQAYDAGPAALGPLYARLCVREEPLNDEEADSLGIKTTVRVYRAREQLRAPPPAATADGTGANTNAKPQPPVAPTKEKVIQVMKDVFGMEDLAAALADDSSGGKKKKKA